MEKLEVRVDKIASQTLPAGSNLLSDSESYLSDLNDEELNETIGGVPHPSAVPIGGNPGGDIWRSIKFTWVTMTQGPLTKGPSVVN
jgi:hypothetical protein